MNKIQKNLFFIGIEIWILFVIWCLEIDASAAWAKFLLLFLSASIIISSTKIGCMEGLEDANC